MTYPLDRVRSMLWELAQRPGVRIAMWGVGGWFSITDERRLATWIPRSYDMHELAQGWNN